MKLSQFDLISTPMGNTTTFRNKGKGAYIDIHPSVFENFRLFLLGTSK
jgi:hypothetical protein